MKLSFLFLTVIVTIAMASFQPNAELDDRWERFKTKFEKQYANAEDELFRRELWEKNVAEIDLHNKEFQEGKHTYTLGENKFSDMTKEEWKQYLNIGK